MNNPLQAFEIEIPANTDPEVFGALRRELGETTGVDQCGPSTTRSLDPASMTMWITLVSTGITTAASLVPVVKQVLELFKRKGIKGAKLKLAGGVTIDVDEISADDLLKLSTGVPKA
jgi:hypothetical protein